MANNSESIKKMVEQLLSDRDQTGDVVFIVEDQQIRAHRNVLAALSPKYKAQFYGPNPDQGEIRITNVSAGAFKEFLQFFYKESVDLTMDNIETVFDLAQQSLVDEFIEICINFLKNAITPINVCFVYRLANVYDIGTLCRICERLISTKTIDVFASDGFLQCDRNMLMQILNLDTVNCTETDVFNGCIAWARADCRQNGLDEEKPEHLRASLGDAIYQVRFSSIHAQELAAALHGPLNGFFSADELSELFFITSKVNDFTSQNFNQSPRTQPKYNLKAVVGSQAWSLECDRTLCIIENRTNTNQYLDSLIQCDEPIRLYGIAFGFQFRKSELDWFKCNGILYISVARNNGPLIGITLNCKYYESKSETIVMFEHPIEKMNGFEISFPQSSFQVNCELVLKDRIEVDNNKFTCTGDLVTRFFFDSL